MSRSKQPSINFLNWDPTPKNKLLMPGSKEGLDDFSFTNKAADTPFAQNHSFEDYMSSQMYMRGDASNPFKDVSPMTRRMKAKFMEQQRSQRWLSPERGQVDLSKCSH